MTHAVRAVPAAPRRRRRTSGEMRKGGRAMMEDEAVFSVLVAVLRARSTRRIVEPARAGELAVAGFSRRRAPRHAGRRKRSGVQASPVHARGAQALPVAGVPVVGRGERAVRAADVRREAGVRRPPLHGRAAPSRRVPVESLYAHVVRRGRARRRSRSNRGCTWEIRHATWRELVERLGMERTARVRGLPRPSGARARSRGRAAAVRHARTRRGSSLAERFAWLTAYRMRLFGSGRTTPRFYIGLVDVILAIRAQQTTGAMR